MRTRLLYLEDPRMVECSATILDIVRDEAGLAAELSVSPYFPKGGGALSDVGFLDSPDARMRVDKVLPINGRILHYGHMVEGAFSVGDDITASIDTKSREYNSRLHSGGEIICAAVHELGKRWAVTAAAHVPGQARVAFRTDLAPDEVAAFVIALKQRVVEIVERDEPVLTFLDVPEDEVRRLCTLDGDGLEGKKGGIRLVSPVRGFFRPCMGAHVTSTGQIGGIEFRKTRLKSGELSIGYELAVSDRQS